MDKEATASQLSEILEARGVSRRSFMKLCGTLAVMAGLGEAAAPRVAQAVESSVIGAASGNLYPVIWMEGASCTGCTESFAQIDAPDAASVVLELISLNYCETLSAAAGESMELARTQTIEQAAGNYILVYEGAVLKGWEGNAFRIAGEVGYEPLKETAANAAAVVALGSCAVNGGWCAAKQVYDPNGSDARAALPNNGAMGVQQFLTEEGIDVPVINIPGCPPNPEWLCAVLVNVLMLNAIPELTDEGKPAQIFSQTIHDNCERRGHFENGEFVYEFGSEEERKGYCLYAMGCKGPQTFSNCSVIRFNNRRSWCVASGAPCVGCTAASPMHPEQNWVDMHAPFFKRHRTINLFGMHIQPQTIALSIIGVEAVALVVHGFGMKAAGRTKGAPIEYMRDWDAKHPDKSIGAYSEEEVAAYKAAKEAKKGGNK
ncbi:MAG: hydrogenase small subunit [Eggerthellales bacterium]|nr:hydrogenase small subunit [Eggerthellales bacterium]